MKKAGDIIKSIQSQPQFKKLQNFKCIDKILHMFLPRLHRFIEFCYIKNETLFIVLNHHGGKIEFDNSIKTIKDILNYNPIEECLSLNLKEIKTFVTNKPRKRVLKKEEKITNSIYPERAKGEFDIDVFKDEKLKKIALEIKEIIKG
jgi:hypothetical protein